MFSDRTIAETKLAVKQIHTHLTTTFQANARCHTFTAVTFLALSLLPCAASGQSLQGATFTGSIEELVADGECELSR